MMVMMIIGIVIGLDCIGYDDEEEEEEEEDDHDNGNG